MPRLHITHLRSWLGFWALILLAHPYANAAEEPLLQSLQQRVKTEALELGMIFQVIGDFHSESRYAGQAGFSVANARVFIKGTLDRRFSYLLQTNFVKSPAILDGRIGYELRPALILDAGQFKTPFSREFLVAASDIDFVNRSQVVTILAPGRQIGMQVRGDLGKTAGGMERESSTAMASA